MVAEGRPALLVVSEDCLLVVELRRIFDALGLRMEAVTDGGGVLAATHGVEEGESMLLVLLDTRLPGVASGRLLAALDEAGVHQRCAVALIAEQVTDEWIARLREGVIDDIVPRSADASAWQTHLSTMQRGHALLRDLKEMREASLREAQVDALTGALSRDALLTALFRETDRVQRLQGMLSLILLGVDDFARWCAELGQAAADQLLKQVAQRMGRGQRSYDALGRMGPAELMLALPGCSMINAVMLAERMRGDVFGETFWVKNAQGEIVEVKLSGCYGLTASRGRSPVVVVREAEQTLALARRLGPNTMRCAGDAPTGDAAARLFPEAELLMR